MEIKKRLYFLLFSIFVVFMIGSLGYYFLFKGEQKFIDCAYMTVISLTSVGYGEVLEITGNIYAQIFTMIVITFGMGIILYAISTLTALVIEGELTGIIKINKMKKQIDKLTDHIIVCGGGRTGFPLIDELTKNKIPVVLIDSDEIVLGKTKNIYKCFYVKGDATDDNNLIIAGIERASGIIIALSSDKDNLYITMTARMLNSKIRIISRMSDKNIEMKLKNAGADKVVCPNAIGALRMASEMIRPTAVDFLDTMLRSSHGNLRIHDIIVSEKSDVSGKKIIETKIQDKYNLLILGFKDKDNEIVFNPSGFQVLNIGATLIVMGEIDDIKEAIEHF
jgi:voltage-gated potassium channel